ncbi:MAG: hypothetical protein JNN30_14745 [Rhodanobacteraceae bacterium]|nr:hypothetical protein [Rhodanobacteraceae bacterium]
MNVYARASSLLLLMLSLVASPLAAADAINVEVNTGAVPVPTGPLDAEFIAKTVNVRGPSTLVIHYFAECQVERGHVEYDIVVNRSILAVTARQVPPTNDSLSALCSNDGDTTESNLRAKSVGTVVACTVSLADNYTVKVRGHVESPSLAGPGVVDDQSLVIEEHPFSSGLPPCVFELPGGIGQ